MRRTLWYWLALLVVLVPAEARLSSSSEIVVESALYRLRLESPRIHFAPEQGDTGQQEAEWHARWNAENGPLMKKVRALLDAHLAKESQGFKLIKLDDALPEIWGTDPELLPDGYKPDMPCRYSFYIGGISMTVAFETLPAKTVRQSFKKELSDLLMPTLTAAPSD